MFFYICYGRHHGYLLPVRNLTVWVWFSIYRYGRVQISTHSLLADGQVIIVPDSEPDSLPSLTEAGATSSCWAQNLEELLLRNLGIGMTQSSSSSPRNNLGMDGGKDPNIHKSSKTSHHRFCRKLRKPVGF
jgi:hypothetical protein